MVTQDPNTIADLQGFYHVRITIGLVVGLSITRILAGFARFVQSPEQNKVHAPHLVWSCFLLLFVIHFWWAEFGLRTLPRWQFQDFLFVIFYAALIFFTAALLYPDKMDEYSGFADYFQSRHVWIYSFLIAILLVDIGDTFLKGWAHAQSLGWPYAARQAALIGIALAGIVFGRRPIHLGLACAAILIQFAWIVARYRFLE